MLVAKGPSGGAIKQTSQGFRDRAKDCRNLAKGSRHVADRIMLEEIAEELDAEAKRMDAETDNDQA